MMGFLSYLVSRLKEPSSYAGLGGLLAMIGLHLDPGLVQSIAGVLAAIAGAVAFFLPSTTPPSA